MLANSSMFCQSQLKLTSNFKRIFANWERLLFAAEMWMFQCGVRVKLLLDIIRKEFDHFHVKSIDCLVHLQQLLAKNANRRLQHCP